MNVAPCDECVLGRATNSIVIPPRPLCREYEDLDGMRHWCEKVYPHRGRHVAYCGRQWSDLSVGAG